jgi:hypothetical protein
MKNCIAVAVVVLLATGTSAFASLAPYYDSVERIQTVLASTRLAGTIDDHITSITEMSDLHYEVVVGKCSVQVSLEAHPPGKPGKTTYTVSALSQPKCQ